MKLSDQIKILDFAELGDERGNLVVIEGENQDIPFDIKRVFYIYGSDATVVRGQHANRRTKFVLINDLIHQWLIVLPFSFLAAYVFQAPVWVTFFCLKSDQILKCFVAVIKVNRFGWIRNLTKE